MINPNFLKLVEIIKEYEGWKCDDLKTPLANEETLAFRNNNFGNLRESIFSQGNKGGYAYFLNETLGETGLLFDLYCKCTGRTGTALQPKSTVRDLIRIYCGETPEVNQRYLDYVCQRGGFSPDMKLSEFAS